MGKIYQLEFDGQSVTQDDYNGLAEAAGLSDDKVFAELFRLTPDAGSIAKGVIPYAHATSGTTPLIAAAGATGTVKVNPFRALVGSRTVEATDAALCWQDIRSGISVADGATTLATTISLAANASGNPRWDAIYAVLNVDDPLTPETRKVKNPGTGLVTDESVSVLRRVTVSVASVAGTPGASPAFPSIPADAGDIYYIILGYVRVPDGFGAGSTVDNQDINTVAPVLSVTRAMGVATLCPANGNFKTGGAGISGATSGDNGVLSWTGTAATRPGCYMPPTMQGQESRIIALDLENASSASWSHQSGDIVDDSIDWRNRLFKWIVVVGVVSGSAAKFPWKHGIGSDSASMMWGGAAWDFNVALNSNNMAMAAGVGQSMGATAGQSTVATPTIPGTVVGAGSMYLYVDQATGALKVSITGTPNLGYLFWLDATAPYENL